MSLHETPAFVPNSAAKGHSEYRAWLAAAGECFSPLHPAGEPLRFGTWTSWTVEGFYQGLKLFAVRDCSLIHPSLEFEVLRPGVPCLIHVPGVMEVREGLRQHFFFCLLKSGRKYNSMKNRYFGRLNRRAPNWAWTGTWRHPERNIPVTRGEFIADVFAPALSETLSRHPSEVARLKSFWNRGQLLITDEMHRAHGHLRHIERYVQEFACAVCEAPAAAFDQNPCQRYARDLPDELDPSCISPLLHRERRHQ